MPAYGDGTRAVYASADFGAVISPWLEELIEQYHAAAQKRAVPRLALVVFSMLVGLAALTCALPYLHSAAYPQEFVKEQALQICSQTDPTFLRFLASERDACYERINDAISRAGIVTTAAHRP